MATVLKQVELPPRDGYLRTPLGIYIADHKAPVEMTAPKTFEHIYREGSIPIPNTYWSRVATMTNEEMEAIENPDVRRETKQARRLMLEDPLQFVYLLVIGNRILVEPYGFGVKVLGDRLKTSPIEVYDHDVSEIVLGKAQEKYGNAKLWADGSANDDDVRFAVRGGFGGTGRRFGVALHLGPRLSYPFVAGLGFRPEGNQAYFDPRQHGHLSVSSPLLE